MITIDSLIDEMLGQKPEEAKPSFFNRIFRRKDILKRLDDERQANREKVILEGGQAEVFLNSPQYEMFIDSQVRDIVKSSLQKILREGEKMTEAELKSEIVSMKRVLRIPASIKLKVLSAEAVKKDA